MSLHVGDVRQYVEVDTAGEHDLAVGTVGIYAGRHTGSRVRQVRSRQGRLGCVRGRRARRGPGLLRPATAGSAPAEPIQRMLRRIDAADRAAPRSTTCVSAAIGRELAVHHLKRLAVCRADADSASAHTLVELPDRRDRRLPPGSPASVDPRPGRPRARAPRRTRRRVRRSAGAPALDHRSQREVVRLRGRRGYERLGEPGSKSRPSTDHTWSACELRGTAGQSSSARLDRCERRADRRTAHTRARPAHGPRHRRRAPTRLLVDQRRAMSGSCSTSSVISTEDARRRGPAA